MTPPPPRAGLGRLGEVTAPTQLEISISGHPLTPAVLAAVTEVQVRARVAGGAAFVDVTDHGPGVPPDLKRDLFRAYAHGAEQRGSAERSIGLGLAIARLIAEAHGGQLMLDSEPEKGTTATLRIPLQPGG